VDVEEVTAEFYLSPLEQEVTFLIVQSAKRIRDSHQHGSRTADLLERSKMRVAESRKRIRANRSFGPHGFMEHVERSDDVLPWTSPTIWSAQ
jgi:hypothetical protein